MPPELRLTRPAPAPLARRDDPDARYLAAIAELWGRLESKESQRGYRDDWGRYVTWLESQQIDPREARVSDVQRYVNELRDNGKAKSTRARALSVVREVYRALVIAEECAVNPAREVKNPKVSAEPRTPWLDEDKLRRFFDATGGEAWHERRDRTVLLCLAMLGARRAEVARLCVEDFADGSVRLRVKRAKEARVGVPPYLAAEVAAWRASTGIHRGPLFPRSEGDAEAISGKMVHDAVKRCAKAAGIEQVTPHGLRRTFITILRRRGVPLKELQSAVVHESGSTTERYDKAAMAAQNSPGEGLRDLVERRTK